MMTKLTTTRIALLAAAGALAVGAFAVPAMAQRDPAYAAARANGSVGERINGYLGIVGAATPELQRLVDDINNQRRQVYAERAQAEGADISAQDVPTSTAVRLRDLL